LAQLNDFNRSQFACRGMLTPDGLPSVMYAALVDNRLTQDQTKAHLGSGKAASRALASLLTDPVGSCQSRIARPGPAAPRAPR